MQKQAEASVDKLVGILRTLQQSQADTTATVRTLMECVRILAARIERLEARVLELEK